MYYASDLTDGSVVKRKKLGVIDHVGIIVYEYGHPTVIHKTPGKGVIQETLEEFASGAAVEPAREYHSTLPAWTVANKARSAVGRKWSLFDNCQHFVTEVLGLKKESRQLQLGLCLLAVCFVAYKVR